MTDAAKITERFHRTDFGHLEIEITVDDPKAYTKPWTVKLNQVIALDTDLLDFVCADNEKDVPHLSANSRRLTALAGFTVLQRQGQRIRRPTGCHGRDPLVVFVREAAFEILLELRGAADDVPRAIGALRAQQEPDAFADRAS